MDFLADESFDFRLVRALRAAGHSVMSVMESVPGADDEAVIRLAADTNRILLTEDKDFGWLVYVTHSASRGVVLVRCRESDRGSLAARLVGLILTRASELQDSFVVVTLEKARFSRLPDLSA